MKNEIDKIFKCFYKFAAWLNSLKAKIEKFILDLMSKKIIFLG